MWKRHMIDWLYIAYWNKILVKKCIKTVNSIVGLGVKATIKTAFKLVNI